MQERIVESGVSVSCGVITAGPEYGALGFCMDGARLDWPIV